MKKNSLPKYFDPKKIAIQHKTISGSVDVQSCKQVIKSLSSTKGSIFITLSGSKSIDNRLIFTGDIVAELAMTCQRCLEEMMININSRFKLMGAWTEEQAQKIPSDFDPLLLDQKKALEILPLVEEEILLALPIVAFHSENTCQTPQ